jgi:hypothetical protein
MAPLRQKMVVIFPDGNPVSMRKALAFLSGPGFHQEHFNSHLNKRIENQGGPGGAFAMIFFALWARQVRFSI